MWDKIQKRRWERVVKLELGKVPREDVQTAEMLTLREQPPEVLAARAADVVAKLEDENENMRTAAMLTLSKAPREVLAARAAAVVAKLEDENENMRTAAMLTLSQLPPEVLAAHATAVVAKLKDENENMRTAAMMTLGSLPPEVLAKHPCARSAFSDCEANRVAIGFQPNESIPDESGKIDWQAEAKVLVVKRSADLMFLQIVPPIPKLVVVQLGDASFIKAGDELKMKGFGVLPSNRAPGLRIRFPKFVRNIKTQEGRRFIETAGGTLQGGDSGGPLLHRHRRWWACGRPSESMVGWAVDSDGLANVPSNADYYRPVDDEFKKLRLQALGMLLEPDDGPVGGGLDGWSIGRAASMDRHHQSREDRPVGRVEGGPAFEKRAPMGDHLVPGSVTVEMTRAADQPAVAPAPAPACTSRPGSTTPSICISKAIPRYVSWIVRISDCTEPLGPWWWWKSMWCK